MIQVPHDKYDDKIKKFYQDLNTRLHNINDYEIKRMNKNYDEIKEKSQLKHVEVLEAFFPTDIVSVIKPYFGPEDIVLVSLSDFAKSIHSHGLSIGSLPDSMYTFDSVCLKYHDIYNKSRGWYHRYTYAMISGRNYDPEIVDLLKIKPRQERQSCDYLLIRNKFTKEYMPKERDKDYYLVVSKYGYYYAWIHRTQVPSNLGQMRYGSTGLARTVPLIWLPLEEYKLQKEYEAAQEATRAAEAAARTAKLQAEAEEQERIRKFKALHTYRPVYTNNSVVNHPSVDNTEYTGDTYDIFKVLSMSKFRSGNTWFHS
jgi:hypothetical protein